MKKYLLVMTCVAMSLAAPRAEAAPLVAAADHALVLVPTRVEPTWLTTWGFPQPRIGAGGLGLALNFVTSAVPEAARQQIVMDVWNHVTQALKRTVQVVTYRTNSPYLAYILLGVEGGADGDDPDDEPDSYTESEDADYDNDGRFDSHNGRVTSLTPRQVAMQINGWLTGADAYLRQHGR